MAKYVQANKNFNYKINFIVDGEFVVPSAATITITDNAGDVVESLEDEVVTLVADQTSAVYTIVDDANQITLPFEIRYITVNFTYGSKTYIIDDYYVLKESLHLPITKDEVRDLIGFSITELTDNQIDLFVAYSDLQADVTEATLDSLIADGSALIPQIQAGVKAKAALNGLGMIELTVFQSEQADNTLYKRFQSVDFKSSLDRLKETYDRAVSLLNGIDVGANSLAYSTIATPTDPVTGA